jgi:hypothetical protein
MTRSRCGKVCEEARMIDPLIEKIFLVSMLPQVLFEMGFKGKSGKPKHRTYGYRMVDAGLEVLVYCGEMYSSREAVIRHLQRKAEGRRQKAERNTSNAEQDAAEANERLRNTVFNGRSGKGANS